MSNFSFSSALKLARFGLKINVKQIVGWCISIFSIMFLYMILFPSVKDMAQIKLDIMPKELLQFVGMNSMSDMRNYISYFGMIFNIILIAISIFAATFSANLIYKEEKEKTIEFLYSLEISRSEIYISKLIVAFVAVLAVICSGVTAAAICGGISGGSTFIVGDFIKIAVISGFTVFFFMALSLMLAGISAKIGAPMVGSMAVLLCYVLGVLSNLLGKNAKWLSRFSPFELFAPSNAVILEHQTCAALAVYFVILICFIVVGAVIYKRRDFVI